MTILFLFIPNCILHSLPFIMLPYDSEKRSSSYSGCCEYLFKIDKLKRLVSGNPHSMGGLILEYIHNQFVNK